MGENIAVIKYECKINNLLRIQQIAKFLKEKLQNDDFHATPALNINNDSDKYLYFDAIILNFHVVKNQVGSSYDNGSAIYYSYSYSVPRNLDNHFKPLDIVWVKCLNKF